MAFTPITVTRRYLSGELVAASGYVRFTPSAPMTNGDTVVSAPVTAQLDAEGDIAIVLAANDDTGTTPNTPDHASYLVEERIIGQPLRTYYVQVPYDAPGATVDLGTLNAATVPPVVTYPAPGPKGDTGADSTVPGPPGADGVDGVDGTNGTNGLGVPAGGATGTFLRKTSGADNATAWQASGDIPATLVDAKGDVLVGSANDTPARLAVGTDGSQIVADSSQATGLAWSANPPPKTATITDATTPVGPDASAARVFKLTALGSRTLAKPTAGAVDGRVIIIRHTASGGARTLTLATGAAGAYAFGSDITGLAATASGKTDVIACMYDAVADRWWVIGVAAGY